MSARRRAPSPAPSQSASRRTLTLGAAARPTPSQYGANPDLPPPQRGLLPNMDIADPARWGDRRPTVPQGWTDHRHRHRPEDSAPDAGAAERRHPGRRRQGRRRAGADAEGLSSPASSRRKARRPVKGGDRLTLLRDADGDGTYEGRWVFAENLNAPYGLALIGNRLYVANQDALVRFDYQHGQTRGRAPPVTVDDAAVGDQPPLDQGADRQRRRPLPLCRHRLQQQHRRARPGGRGEPRDGLADRRRDRRARGRSRPACATRPRWPSSRAAGQLWAVVNERDETRPEPGARLPDLGARRRLLRLAVSATGARTSTRACGRRTRRRSQAAVRPDYALRSHVGAARPGVRDAGDGAAVSPTAPSSASTAAGTAPSRSATRWSSCRSANGRPAGRAGRLRHRLPGRRQDAGPPGRRDGRCRGCADRRRRSVQHVWRVTPAR